MIAPKSKTCCLLAKNVSKLFCTCAATPPDPRGQRSLSSRYITGFLIFVTRHLGGRATVNGGNGNENGNGNGKGSSKLQATIAVQLKMEEIYGWYANLPNHKFPNPTHYVQVHLKSTTLTFSALTSLHRCRTVFLCRTFILFNYAHACLL